VSLLQCPECFHVLTSEQVAAARYDYGCPHCHVSFKYFIKRDSLAACEDARQKCCGGPRIQFDE
jgi:hypothetical protein